jgi:putative alpha-1,2-mannosidase
MRTNGHTSAWYVFSAMGFYPVCPATTQYVLGTPLFKKVTLSLENGKTFVVNAPSSTETNMYILNAELNGIAHDKNWIDHSTILSGGNLTFSMGSSPNKKRGIQSTSFPFSLSKP